MRDCMRRDQGRCSRAWRGEEESEGEGSRAWAKVESRLDVRGSADTCAVDVFDQVEVTWEGTNDWQQQQCLKKAQGRLRMLVPPSCKTARQQLRQQPKNRPSKTVKRASQPNAEILLEESEAEKRRGRGL